MPTGPYGDRSASDTDPARYLLIVGASVRAAAFSALRAGLEPRCADLFADADLRSRCGVLPLSGSYPRCFRTVIAEDVPGPWMYTGGLENEPDLVRELAETRPLWGNGEEVLRKVREPAFLAAAARRADLTAPRLGTQTAEPGCRWLLKPRRGAGGAGIRFWQGGDASHNPERYYL